MGKSRLGPSGPFKVAFDAAFGSAGVGATYTGDGGAGTPQRLTQTELDVVVDQGSIVIIAGLQQTPSATDPISVYLGYQRQTTGIVPWTVGPALGTNEDLQAVMGSFSGLIKGNYKVAVFASSDTNWDLDQFNILALCG